MALAHTKGPTKAKSFVYSICANAIDFLLVDVFPFFHICHKFRCEECVYLLAR